MTSTWRGSTALTEKPDSPAFEIGSDRVACVRVFEGPYAKCLSDRPSPGQGMSGVPAAFKLLVVSPVLVKRAPGGKGVLTVTMEGSPPKSEIQAFETNEEFSLDWETVERPLGLHPRYQKGVSGKTPEGGLAQKMGTGNKTYLERCDEYLEAQSDSEKTTIWAEIGTYTLCDDYVLKREKGIESYNYYAPVVTRTCEVRKLPQVTACGKKKVEDKPHANSTYPPGYEWLKTADKYRRQGRAGPIVRTEQWTGAEDVDTDLYPEET